MLSLDNDSLLISYSIFSFDTFWLAKIFFSLYYLKNKEAYVCPVGELNKDSKMYSV